MSPRACAAFYDPAVARPTLRHVALAARVSPTTVSRVLNGQGNYSAETIKAVRDAAVRLGYRTDTAARSIRMGRRPIVAALIDRELTRATAGRPRMFWLHYLDELVDRVSRSGAGVLTLPYEAADSLKDFPVDALVLITPRVDRTLDIPSFGLPTAGFATDETFSINASHDYPAAANQVWQYLRDRGSARPALILNDGEGDFVTLLRSEFVNASAQDSVVPRIGSYRDESDVPALVSELLEQDVDSIFVLGGASRPVHSVVVGAGRTGIPIVVQSEGTVEEYLDPPLTTLSFCARQSAALTADALLNLGPISQPKRIVLPHRLIAR